MEKKEIINKINCYINQAENLDDNLGKKFNNDLLSFYLNKIDYYINELCKLKD
jgi:hypothetical protein